MRIPQVLSLPVVTSYSGSPTTVYSVSSMPANTAMSLPAGSWVEIECDLPDGVLDCRFIASHSAATTGSDRKGVRVTSNGVTLYESTLASGGTTKNLYYFTFNNPRGGRRKLRFESYDAVNTPAQDLYLSGVVGVNLIPGWTGTFFSAFQQRNQGWGLRTPQRWPDAVSHRRFSCPIWCVLPTRLITGISWDYGSAAWLGGAYLECTSTSTTAILEFTVGPIERGTWTMSVIGRGASNKGISTITMTPCAPSTSYATSDYDVTNGWGPPESIGSEISCGTLDWYTASNTNNYTQELTGIALPRSGFYTVKMKMFTKNASSSSYQAIFQYLDLIRTGS